MRVLQRTLNQKQTQEQSLPNGWTTASLRELSVINPRFGKDELPEDLEVTFLPMRCVEELSGKIDASNVKHVSEVRKGYTPFQEEDVIFAKITPCMENGKIAVARDLRNRVGFGSSEFHVIRPHASVSRGFLFYFLVRSNFRKEAERNMTGSAGQRRVPTSYIKEATMPLPPVHEQRRIVQKIEELFTKLDAGVRSLKQTQALLKSYRRSVLKAAVEGELSREWREAHEGEIEPAQMLLKQILGARQKQWRGKWKEPKPPKSVELPGLPETWAWASLEQVTSLVTKGSSPNWQGFDYVGDGVAFVRSQNVGWGRIDLTNVVYLPVEFNQKQSKSILQPGDLLLNIVGASIGRAAIAPPELKEANTNQAVAVVRLVEGGLYAKFLLYYLISPAGQARIHKEKVEVARANISLTEVAKLAVPLPSRIEQRGIIREVERRLSIVDNLEATVDANLRQADSLRQSILERAFSGKLVPQDPNDEPASVLLERIREESQFTKQKSGERRQDKTGTNKSAHAEQRGLF